jgi:hypothetical protein
MNRRDILRTATYAAATESLGAPGYAVAANAPSEQHGAGNVRPVDVNQSVVHYIAAWNERDPTKRRELVAKTWIEDGTYIDAARNGDGHDGLDQMLQTAQDHWPGYRLSLASGIETHNGYVRFSWAAGGTPEAPLYINGTDIAAMTEDGRFKWVIGFVNAAPARQQKH